MSTWNNNSNNSNDSDWGGGWSNTTAMTPTIPATTPTAATTTISSTNSGGGGNANLENEIFSECHTLITKNIQQLSALFDDIKANLQFLGKKSDTKKFRETLNEKIATAQKILRETQSQLKRLDGIATNSQRQKEKKQKVIKLTQDIESKLNVPFHQLILQARKLMDEIPVPVSSVFGNSSSDEKNPLLQEGYQQYFKVADDTAFQDGLIYERERDIAGIQRQVVEVNEIFRDIGKMIADQTPGIETIQSHISDVVTNVKTADSEVTEANELHKKSGRKLCFIALGVIIITAIVVVIVVIVLKTRGTI